MSGPGAGHRTGTRAATPAPATPVPHPRHRPTTDPTRSPE